MIDTATRLTLLQERFKSRTEREYAKALLHAQNSVLAKIQNTADDAMRKRLIVIRSLIEKEMGAITKLAIPAIQEDIQGFAEISHATMFKALNTSTGVGYAFAALPASTIKEIIDMERVQLYGDKGYTLAQLFNTEEMAQIDRYKVIINSGLASNSGYAEIGRRLKQANETSMKNIKAIVHTSISSARDISDGKAFESFDDVITGWKSVGVLDSRTSLLCGSLDGKKYMKKDGFKTYAEVPNHTPRHFFCRSKIIAQTMFSEGMNTTRSENGDNKSQIDSKTNFKDWFANQSPKFQSDYLGKARYELYKSGRFTIDKFIDVKDGTRFTLDELRGVMADTVKSVKVHTIDFKTISDNDTFNNHFTKIQDDRIVKIVNSMPSLNKKYGAEVFKNNNFSLTTSGRGSQYDMWNRNLSISSKDIDSRATVLHEYGHFVDNTLMVVSKYDKYPTAEIFISMNEDIKALSLTSKTKAGKEQILSIFANIDGVNNHQKADILDAFSSGHIFDSAIGAGHGKKYYKSVGQTGAETFANLFALKADGIDIEDLKQYFPNTINKFEEILTEASSAEQLIKR